MSIEADINKQYEQYFVQDDWRTFKYAADYYLENAANSLKVDIKHKDERLKLLFRNIQKRLYIGIGCEFILKAIYLKNGYVINKRNNHEIPPGRYPFKACEIQPNDFSKNKTFTFNELLQKLFKIIDFGDERAEIEKGLRIAKVFRNKEGHVVTISHEYVAQNYRDVEGCLKLLYRNVFNEKLSIFIAFGKNEIGEFEVNS